jgi:hypothetical protein
MNEIDILKRNSTYTLEEKLLNTGISVYGFSLFEKNITNYASAYMYNVLEREREREREREISRGTEIWGNHRGLSFEMLKLKKKIISSYKDTV